jgi:Arc/MetJ-type ribon-helix-helix transcriptional regulator
MGFRKVSLKGELVSEVENAIKKAKTYRSIAEFVSEAVRLRLESISKREGDDVRES